MTDKKNAAIPADDAGGPPEKPNVKDAIRNEIPNIGGRLATDHDTGQQGSGSTPDPGMSPEPTTPEPVIPEPPNERDLKELAKANQNKFSGKERKGSE